jgi:putative transposase
MVSHAAQYAWSSHSHFAGARKDPAITEHPVFLALGASIGERQSAFCALSSEPLAPHLVEEIRIAINTDSALGSAEFLDNAEATLGRSVRPPKRGRPFIRAAPG